MHGLYLNPPATFFHCFPDQLWVISRRNNKFITIFNICIFKRYLALSFIFNWIPIQISHAFLGLWYILNFACSAVQPKHTWQVYEIILVVLVNILLGSLQIILLLLLKLKILLYQILKFDFFVLLYYLLYQIFIVVFLSWLLHHIETFNCLRIRNSNWARWTTHYRYLVIETLCISRSSLDLLAVHNHKSLLLMLLNLMRHFSTKLWFNRKLCRWNELWLLLL